MSSAIRRNVVANFAGNAWSAMLGLAFTAFYFRILGPENFGLVSVSLLLQTLAQVFDLGLSGTINRELARTSSGDSKGENPVVILNTLGVLNLSFALACTLLFLLTAPWIATSWLNANQLSSETIQACLRWMGISFVLQSIANFYSAGLSGLQLQVVQSALNAGFLTARHLTAACCLIFVAPSIELFFISQLPVLLLQAGVSAIALYRRIGGQGRSRVFDRGIIRSCWRFSAAFAGTNITSLFVSQLDRIVLSKTLPLDQFGLYGLASNIALNLLRVVQPVYAAFYPRFTQIVAAGGERELALLYARGCSLVGLLVFPAAAVLVVLASPVLSFFTGSPNLSDSARIVLIILALGTAVGACNQLPYALQQAHGDQTFALRLNLLYLVVYSPLLCFLSIDYGAVGASVAVLILNLVNFIFFPVYSARTYLGGALVRFYLNTFLFPITLAFVPMLALSRMLPEPSSKLVLIATCLGAALLSYGSVSAGFLLKSRLSGRPVFG